MKNKLFFFAGIQVTTLSSASPSTTAFVPTAAELAGNAPKIVVHYDSQMLATDNGVHTLYRRLNAAADKVCVQEDYGRWVSAAVRACRKQAVERAVEQINNPRLAALQAAQSKSG